MDKQYNKKEFYIIHTIKKEDEKSISIRKSGFNDSGKQEYELYYKGERVKGSIDLNYLQNLIVSEEYLNLYNKKFDLSSENNKPTIRKQGFSGNKQLYGLYYNKKRVKSSTDYEYLESLIASGEYKEIYKNKSSENRGKPEKLSPSIRKQGFNRAGEQRYSLYYNKKRVKESFDFNYLQKLIDTGEYLEIYNEKFSENENYTQAKVSVSKAGLTPNGEQRYAIVYKQKLLKTSTDPNYLQTFIDSGEYLTLYEDKDNTTSKNKSSKSRGRPEKLSPSIRKQGKYPNGKRRYGLYYQKQQLKTSTDPNYLQTFIDSGEYLTLYEDKIKSNKKSKKLTKDSTTPQIRKSGTNINGTQRYSIYYKKQLIKSSEDPNYLQTFIDSGEYLVIYENKQSLKKLKELTSDDEDLTFKKMSKTASGKQVYGIYYKEILIKSSFEIEELKSIITSKKYLNIYKKKNASSFIKEESLTETVTYKEKIDNPRNEFLEKDYSIYNKANNPKSETKLDSDCVTYNKLLKVDLWLHNIYYPILKRLAKNHGLNVSQKKENLINEIISSIDFNRITNEIFNYMNDYQYLCWDLEATFEPLSVIETVEIARKYDLPISLNKKTLIQNIEEELTVDILLKEENEKLQVKFKNPPVIEQIYKQLPINEIKNIINDLDENILISSKNLTEILNRRG